MAAADSEQQGDGGSWEMGTWRLSQEVGLSQVTTRFPLSNRKRVRSTNAYEGNTGTESTGNEYRKHPEVNHDDPLQVGLPHLGVER